MPMYRKTPYNTLKYNCHSHKNCCWVCLPLLPHTTLNSPAWGSLQGWATWRQRRRPEWKWPRGSPWIIFSQQKVAKMKSATLVPKIHNFIPNIPFVFKISPTNHLLWKYLKETTYFRGLPRTLVSLLALLSLSPFLDSTIQRKSYL